MTLSVDGVRDWSVFAVKHDPGKRLVLAAAVLLLIGLVLTLTIRRRRVWVRATALPRNAADEGPGRTLIEVGGVTRAGDNSDEFDELVGRLQESVTPVDITSQGAEERETRVESQ
jgi:cytochrome c biogenesis protein